MIYLLVALWFLTGWLAWRFFVWDHTKKFDITRSTRNMMRPLLVLCGLASFISGVINIALDFYEERRTPKDRNEIIYPRKAS